MQTIYTKVKVHNEVELCETADMDVKSQIEKTLLENRISYYIKWYKQGFFWNSKNVCVFCVNENSKDEAEELINGLAGEHGDKIRFLMSKSKDCFF